MLCPRLCKPCLKWLLMIPTIIFITKCTQNYSSKTNYRSSMSLPLLPNDFLEMDDAIFFIETNSSEIKLKPRLTCAIERVAKVYPKRPIIVILNQQRSQCVPAFLSQLPNVHFRSIEIDHFVQGSAVEALWKSGKVKSSIWSLSNISNLLRFLVVFKFGGLYLDHDVIALKPMPENETNFICLVRPDRVASAIFQLNKGHPLLKLTLERMAETFNGNIWGHNGPDLFAKAASEYCGKQLSQTFLNVSCPDLKIQNTKFATPFPCPDYLKFYRAKYNAEILSGIVDSYFLHYCNKKRTGTQNPNATDSFIVQTNQPLYQIMKNACPMTEENILRKHGPEETLPRGEILPMPNSIDAIEIVQNWNQFQIDRRSFWAKPVPEMFNSRPKFQAIKSNTHHSLFNCTQNSSVLIFNRNRKTGSTFVLDTLWNLGQKLHFQLNPLNLDPAPLSLSKSQEMNLVKRMSNVPQSVSMVYWNHFFYIDVSLYNHSWTCNWINFVRNPIDWFLSDFYYRRRPDRLWEKDVKPPQEWFERDAELCILEQDPECFFQKGQYRIQQLTYFCGSALECRKVGSVEALERAMAIVESRFAVVGITEDLAGSLSVMEAFLPRFFKGFRSLTTLDKVINGHPHDKNISTVAKLKLEEMFHHDMIFYRFVQERLKRQMQSLNLVSTMNGDVVKRHSLE